MRKWIAKPKALASMLLFSALLNFSFGLLIVDLQKTLFESGMQFASSTGKLVHRCAMWRLDK